MPMAPLPRWSADRPSFPVRPWRLRTLWIWRRVPRSLVARCADIAHGGKGERGRADSHGIRLALDHAEALQCSALDMMAGIAPAKERQAKASYLNSLAYVADRASEVGVDVVIEPINDRRCLGISSTVLRWRKRSSGGSTAAMFGCSSIYITGRSWVAT